MFVESWLEKRKKEGRRLLAEELRAKIRSTGKPLTEQDLEELLEKETAHILPTNSR